SPVRCSVAILLSCDCFAAPPALLSFPTRRSSDLPRRSSHEASTVGTAIARTRRWHRRWASPTSPSTRSSSAHELLGSRVTLERRSEEHTSELQSRENLVCRLLLEKKKRSRYR